MLGEELQDLPHPLGSAGLSERGHSPAPSASQSPRWPEDEQALEGDRLVLGPDQLASASALQR